MFDGEKFGLEVVEIVRSYMDAQVAGLQADNAALVARIVELEARAPVAGPQGDPGPSGADGITPEFIEAGFVGRSLNLTFGQGDQVRTVAFSLAVPEYAGAFTEGATYQPGDMVTWAGSMWHCDEFKGMKPGVAESGWTLAVKKGRDGKDARKETL